MLFSVCIPCYKREADLAQTLASREIAAHNAPPVEILVLDYQNYNDHWYPSHAFNLCLAQARGEFIWLQGADMFTKPEVITQARELIEQGYEYLYERHHKGAIVCNTKALRDAGGWDERFTLYGKEDRELDLRLKRRGLRWGLLPDGCVTSLHTADADKVKNYNVSLSKGQMSSRMADVYQSNAENYVLAVNLWN